jgi:hypothetical protein
MKNLTKRATRYNPITNIITVVEPKLLDIETLECIDYFNYCARAYPRRKRIIESIKIIVKTICTEDNYFISLQTGQLVRTLPQIIRESISDYKHFKMLQIWVPLKLYSIKTNLKKNRYR